MQNTPQEIIRLARRAGVAFGAHAFIVVQVTDGIQYAEHCFRVLTTAPITTAEDACSKAAKQAAKRMEECPASSFYVLEVGGPVEAFAPAPIGLDEIASDLAGAICALDHQVEQMKGMFPDDDGAIRAAQDDGDEARKRLDLYRKAVGAGPVEIGVWLAGGVVQDVTVNRAATGFTLVTLDADTEGETDHEALTMVKDVVDQDWSPAHVTHYTADDLSAHVSASLVLRPATPRDLE